MSGKIPSKIGRYSAELSAEYSAVFGRIFGIGRYQFFPYRSYTKENRMVFDCLRKINLDLKWS